MNFRMLSKQLQTLKTSKEYIFAFLISSLVFTMILIAVFQKLFDLNILNGLNKEFFTLSLGIFFGQLPITIILAIKNNENKTRLRNIRNARNVIDELTQRNKEISDEYDELEKNATSNQTKLNNANSEVRDLKKKNNELNEAIKKLTDENRVMTTRNISLTSQNTKLVNACDVFKDAITNKLSEIEKQ